MHDEATRSDYPFLDLLEQHFQAIREEALAVPEHRWVDMPLYPGLQVHLLDVGMWADNYPPVDFDAHRAASPRTMALIEKVDGVEVAGFLRMPAGVSMRKHTDPRDDELVRCHLGLVLPESEQGWWPEGKARLMDPRQPHWAKNDSSRYRMTFVIDVRMPFVVPDNAWGPWRPDDPPEMNA